MPKTNYSQFLLQFLAWLLFFQFTRLVFVLWNLEEVAGLPAGELLRLPFEALYLDTATACYFMGIPFLLFAAAIFSERAIFLTINRFFTAILVVVVSMVTIGELPIYDEWHTKLNYRAISMLGTPSEVVRTATTAQLGWGSLAIVALSMAGIYLFRKMAIKDVEPKRKPYYWSLLFFIIAPCLIAIGLRGGMQQIPIQVSDAYYSQHNILNLAATNSTFNLISSLVHSAKSGKPYQFMPDDAANNMFSELHTVGQDSTTSILTTKTPNIVMVILEGWSSDLIKSSGGYEGVTPNMERMISEGYFFNNCYASGYLSDQGMAAIFSAFPAQPKTSIIKEPNKYERLPCINTELKRQGYHTSFLFGGQLSYGNIRSYLYFNGFDQILEGRDFDSSIPQCKLGVADEYLYARQLEELAQAKEPFFAAMFTLSSHSPYDIPMKEVLHWGDKEKSYINSVYYADKCIHDFIQKAKTTSWYDSTLFVFVSDHGHNSPKNWVSYQPEYRKIPLLFYGEVIKPAYRGKIDSLAAAQTDLAATLLGQLGIAADRYKYSKNLLNPSAQRHAFYSFDEGFCFLKPKGQLCWHVNNQRIDFEKAEKEADKWHLYQEGQALLQVLTKDYHSF